MAEGNAPKPTCEANTILNETNETYNIYTGAFANNHCVCVTCLRESGNQTSSGWTTIAYIPVGYRPKTNITAYFVDGTGTLIRFRVYASDGGVSLYSIPSGQIGCFISYPI